MAYWLSEGGASIFEYVWRKDLGALPHNLIINPRWVCKAHDLKMASEPGVTTVDWKQFRCNHYLGLNLFRELLEILGNQDFYAEISGTLPPVPCHGEAGGKPGIAEVRQAFQ